MIRKASLRKETVEQLARLWENKDFQVLVKLLRIRIENLGKGMLVIPLENTDLAKDYQKEAEAIVKIINQVKDAWSKMNKNKE